MKTGPRRGHRRAARGRGVRVRHRPPGGLGLHHDAGLPPRHLPGRDRHPESEAAGALQRAARSSSRPSSSTSPRRSASTLPPSGSVRSRRRSAGSTCWTPTEAVGHWKADGLDLSPILVDPRAARPGSARRLRQRAGPRSRPRARPRVPRAVPAGHRRGHAGTRRSCASRNVDRTVGTLLGYEITRPPRRRRPAGGDDRPHLHRLGRAELRCLRPAGA